MSEETATTDTGPNLDEEALSFIRGLRRYGYRYVRPPTAKALVAIPSALDTIIDGLMDEEIGPHLEEAFRATTGDEGSLDRLSALAGELELLRQATMNATVATRKGRPRLPAWTELVAPFLIDFYRKHTGDASGPYFKHDDPNQPENNFTKWFCKRLRDVDKGITPSNCKTLIERYG